MTYIVPNMNTGGSMPTSSGNGGSVKPVSRLTPPKTKAELTGRRKTITPKGQSDPITLHGQDLATISKAIQSTPLKRTTIPPPERIVRCFKCHTQMAIDAVKQSAHGGYMCVSRKGCDERRAMRAAEEGSQNLAKAVAPTPKQSAIKALTPTSESSTPNGMRITQPTAKERTKFDNSTLERVIDEPESDEAEQETERLVISRVPDEATQAFIRVTDEDVPLIPTSVSATERDRGFVYELVDRQGLKMVLATALEAEGFNSVTSHLMGVIVDSVLDTGEITHEGFLTMLGTLAKAARSNGYNSLGFYISQCYFNETGKRIRGF